MKIRALVVDDQPMARERVLSLLAAEEGIEVVGTAASGREAVDAVRRLTPDLVFLDLQMPELDGFGVVEAIGVDRMPLTIFVTAYDVHAVRAFEVHALDYLLKPFGRGRLQQAVARAREHLERNRVGAIAERLTAAFDALQTPRRQGPRLVIRANGRVKFIEVTQIDWVEAEGNYVRLHAGADCHLVRETMANLLPKLGETQFFRIHRSRIVNIDRIKELRLASGGDYDVLLRDGSRLPLSRLYKDALQERLSNDK
jgi:two-component system, LytTR family, response regulator